MCVPKVRIYQESCYCFCKHLCPPVIDSFVDHVFICGICVLGHHFWACFSCLVFVQGVLLVRNAISAVFVHSPTAMWWKSLRPCQAALMAAFFVEVSASQKLENKGFCFILFYSKKPEVWLSPSKYETSRLTQAARQMPTSSEFMYDVRLESNTSLSTNVAYSDCTIWTTVKQLSACSWAIYGPDIRAVSLSSFLLNKIVLQTTFWSMFARTLPNRGRRSLEEIVGVSSIISCFSIAHPTKT